MESKLAIFCRMMHNLIKNTMWLKVMSISTDVRTDPHNDYGAQLRLADTVVNIGGYILEQSVSVRAVPELIVGEEGAAVEFFCKASSPFCIPLIRHC